MCSNSCLLKSFWTCLGQKQDSRFSGTLTCPWMSVMVLCTEVCLKMKLNAAFAASFLSADLLSPEPDPSIFLECKHEFGMMLGGLWQCVVLATLPEGFLPKVGSQNSPPIEFCSIGLHVCACCECEFCPLPSSFPRDPTGPHWLLFLSNICFYWAYYPLQSFTKRERIRKKINMIA